MKKKAGAGPGFSFASSEFKASPSPKDLVSPSCRSGETEALCELRCDRVVKEFCTKFDRANEMSQIGVFNLKS